MRFRSLSLAAYGPFTDQLLDLSGGAPGGLHVVFGPNEAGKSTALRAVTALLYGMDRSPRDAHRHPMQELRVGACLEAQDGTRLDVIRRKKDKDSLRGRDDEPQDEAALTRLLGGVGRELFTTLFGLDHARLAEGGEALLRGGGDIGESLFDAGAGGPPIHRVLEALNSEADTLFKPKARNLELNRAILQYREAQKQGRDAPLRAEAYLAQQQGLDQARARRERLASRRVELVSEQARLERVRRAMPLLALRRQHLDERARLGEVPILPERSSERRQTSEQALSIHRRDAERLRAELSRLESQRVALNVDEALLAIVALDVDDVEALRQELGAYRKAQHDLVKRQAAARMREDEVKAILENLGQKPELGAAVALRVSVGVKARVRELSQQNATLMVELDTARRTLASAERELEHERVTLGRLREPRDARALEEALSEATRAGDLEKELGLLLSELTELEGKLARELAGLGLFAGSASELAALPVPSAELIDELERGLEGTERELTSLRAEAMRLEVRRAELATRIDAVRRAGDVPTEAQLAEARARRAASFRLLRAASAESAPFRRDEELGNAFERAVAEADEVADRLRREATRVAEVAALQAEFASAERELARIAEARQSANDSALAARTAWLAAWQPTRIVPLLPRPMRAWLRRRAEMCEAVARVEHLRITTARMRGERDALRALLIGVLDAPVDDRAGLRALVERSRGELDATRRATMAHKTSLDGVERLERVVAEARTAVASGEQALTAWSEQWTDAVAPVGLGQNATPTQASAVLDELGRLFGALEAARRERRSADGIIADGARFAARVASLVSDFAPELEPLEPAEAASELVRKYGHAREKAAARDRLLAAVASAKAELSEAEHGSLEAERELEELVQEAGVGSVAELFRIEERVARAHEIAHMLADVERKLIEQGDGLGIEELATEAAGFDRDALHALQADVRAELEQATDDLERLAVEIDGIQRGIVELETVSKAADAAQDLASRAATIRELSERWVRARVAAVVLEREIQRYREDNQRPIMKHAAELFPRLTLFAYQGLRVGRESPVLLCVRSDGTEVDVDGLSDGTRRQLYLALRLASLMRWFERNEPLPLVLDDVLIHFDEERACAALRVLGELAAHVQVLFFSHQARLIELARRAVPAERLFLHELAGPQARAVDAAPAERAVVP